MPYPEEFPQHLLGVRHPTSKRELVERWKKASKPHPSQGAKYRAAFNDMADKGKRLEYEILLPSGNAEMEDQLEQILAKFHRDCYLPQACPSLPVPRALISMGNMDYEADFSEVNFVSPEMVPSANYDEAGRANLPIIFDK